MDQRTLAGPVALASPAWEATSCTASTATSASPTLIASALAWTRLAESEPLLACIMAAVAPCNVTSSTRLTVYMISTICSIVCGVIDGVGDAVAVELAAAEAD